MKIGYARVSTDSQDTAMQIAALQKEGCKRIYEEKASGAKADRPEMAKLMEHAREGDVIVVWRLDRLARSVSDLVRIAGELQTRCIDLFSIGDKIETKTANGKLHFHMLAALAQFERDLTRERVNAGLATAREKGRIGGRPKADEGKVAQALAMVKGGMSVTKAAEVAGVSRATVYRAKNVSKTSVRMNGHSPGFETSFETEMRH